MYNLSQTTVFVREVTILVMQVPQMPVQVNWYEMNRLTIAEDYFFIGMQIRYRTNYIVVESEKRNYISDFKQRA